MQKVSHTHAILELGPHAVKSGEDAGGAGEESGIFKCHWSDFDLTWRSDGTEGDTDWTDRNA